MLPATTKKAIFNIKPKDQGHKVIDLNFISKGIVSRESMLVSLYLVWFKISREGKNRTKTICPDNLGGKIYR